MKAWWIHWVKRLWFIPCSLVSRFICLIHAPHVNPVTPKLKKYILPGGWLGKGWLYARWIGRGCSHLLRTLYCLGFGVRRAAMRYSLNYMAYIPMPKLDGFPGTACSEGRSRTLAQSPFPLRAETLGMWAKNWIKTINSHDYSASSPLPPPSVRLILVAADLCALLALRVQERSEDTDRRLLACPPWTQAELNMAASLDNILTSFWDWRLQNSSLLCLPYHKTNYLDNNGTNRLVTNAEETDRIEGRSYGLYKTD